MKSIFSKHNIPYFRFFFVFGIFAFLMIFCGKSHAYDLRNCKQGDIMQQAFCPSQSADTIVDMGNTKVAVGNELLKQSTEIDISLQGVDVDKKESLIVRVAKLLLTLTVVLSVTMIIYNGILYITTTGAGGDPSKIRMNIVYVVLGILLALSSIVIINLLRSAGSSVRIAYFPPTTETSHILPLPVA